MALQQPPSVTQGGCTTARQDRLTWASLICAPGVDRDDSMTVTAGTGLSVTVGPGGAWVSGNTVPAQGYYYAYNDANVTLTIGTADPVDPRIDAVVMTVHDSEYAGSVDDGVLQVVAGTPAPAPVAPTLPDNSVVLAYVPVPAGATGGLVVDDSGRQRARVCTDMLGVTDPDAGAVTLNSAVANTLGPVPSAAWYGARFVGNLVQVQFSFVMATTLTAGSTGNITDATVGSLAGAYRPSEPVNGLVRPSSTSAWDFGITPDGIIGIYSASFPSAVLSPGETMRINVLYPRNDL